MKDWIFKYEGSVSLGQGKIARLYEVNNNKQAWMGFPTVALYVHFQGILRLSLCGTALQLCIHKFQAIQQVI